MLSGTQLGLVKAAIRVMMRKVASASPCIRVHAVAVALGACMKECTPSQSAGCAKESIQRLKRETQWYCCNGLPALHRGIVLTPTVVAL